MLLFSPQSVSILERGGCKSIYGCSTDDPERHVANGGEADQSSPGLGSVHSDGDEINLLSGRFGDETDAFRKPGKTITSEILSVGYPMHWHKSYGFSTAGTALQRRNHTQ